MKKIVITMSVLALAVVLLSGKKGDNVMTKEKGAYVVNTTTLAKTRYRDISTASPFLLTPFWKDTARARA